MARWVELALDAPHGEVLDAPPAAPAPAPPAPEAPPTLTALRRGGAERPAPAPGWLPPEDARRLALLRRHGFQRAQAAQDPDYAVSRQTASVHLRLLLARAALHTGSAAGAVALLGQGDAAVAARLSRAWRDLVGWLEGLDGGGEAGHRANGAGETDGGARRQERIYKEFRPDHGVIERLWDALRAGSVGRAVDR